MHKISKNLFKQTALETIENLSRSIASLLYFAVKSGAVFKVSVFTNNILGMKIN